MLGAHVRLPDHLPLEALRQLILPDSAVKTIQEHEGLQNQRDHL